MGRVGQMDLVLGVQVPAYRWEHGQTKALSNSG